MIELYRRIKVNDGNNPPNHKLALFIRASRMARLHATAGFLQMILSGIR